jgi:hypothetical protein
MKFWVFSVWPGAKMRNSFGYCNDDQRQAGKDTISCHYFGETDD